MDTLAVEAAVVLQGMSGVVFVDILDRHELAREGCISGAFHAPRGILEIWIDPDSPYYKPVFAGPDRFVFYCASGWRSALAARTAQEIGLNWTSHIGGGFAAWRKAGGPVKVLPVQGSPA